MGLGFPATKIPVPQGEVLPRIVNDQSRLGFVAGM